MKKLYLFFSLALYWWSISFFPLTAQLGMPPWRYNESDMIYLSSGVSYIILEEGQGSRPQTGDIVKVHYLGMVENGRVFDNSFARGKPIQVRLGALDIIPGWEEALKLLPIGSKAVIVVPPEFGYGAEGMPPAIPPNATLRFYLEVLAKQTPFEPYPINREKLISTPSGLQYVIFQEGKGEKITPQKRVTMHYDARLSNGTPLGNTFDKGEPFIAITGKEQLFAGWEEGLSYLREGDKATLIIPPQLGPKISGQIPENESILIQLDILKVENYVHFVPYKYSHLPMQKSPSGVAYYLVEKGKGKLPLNGELIKMQYHAVAKGEGEWVFDSTFEKGAPATLILGNQEALQVWDEILPLTPKGSKLAIILPPEKVASEKNLPPIFSPQDTLIFYIELLE